MNFGTSNNNNNNNTGFITFKVQNKNDLRRFRMPASELLSQGGYLSLVERVRSLFSTSSQISLKWLDSDNDWITLTPVEDLNDIFSIAKANGFVKLSVDFEGNNQNQFGKFTAFPDLFRAASSSNTPNANANVNVNAGSTSATNSNTTTNPNPNTNTNTNSSNNTNAADSLADIFELFLGQKNPINTFLNGFTFNPQQQQQQQQQNKQQQQQSNPFLDFQAIGTVTRNVLHALHNYQPKENTSSTSSSTSSSSSSSSRVHTHVSCDGCSASPIIGTRFKCIQCPDFDLCSTCEASGVHGDHILIRLYKPLTPSRREFTSCFPFATASASSTSSSSSGRATTSPCAPFSQFLSGQAAKPFNFQKPFNFSFPVKVEVEVDLTPASSETKQQQEQQQQQQQTSESNNTKQEESENTVDSESHETNDDNHNNNNNNEDDEYVFKPEASTTTPVSSSSSSESTPTTAASSPSPKEIKIQLIKDMGFYDENLISRLLDEKWGRVDLVIAELLNFN